jgi:hypothetical protein
MRDISTFGSPLLRLVWRVRCSEYRSARRAQMALTCPQRLVAGTCAQRAAQVVPGGGEQAGVELAVGGQPGAGAAAAKRLVTEAITPISPAPSR